MTTYALLPGAGGVATYFYSRLVPLLEHAGHEAVPVDLPGDDETAGLHDYADLVLKAVGDRADTVLVAQSLGGFTAPLVARRMPLRTLVFLNAMIPNPGECANDWWANTGSSEARDAAADRHGYSRGFDLGTYFLHDVDPAVAAEGEQYQRNESDAAFESVCDFDAWPEIPIRVVAGADDRFFPVEFQQRVARERLGVEADVPPGGHLLALSQPQALADYLLAV
jgi:pimeloyl-ACP methyl ester carboxylesterase